MNPLEMKKLVAEVKRVDAAKAEMEYRIEDCLSQIDRLKEQIVIQDKRLKELSELLKGSK